MLTDAALLFSARSSLEGLREGGLVGEDEAGLMLRALDGYSGERKEGGEASAAALAAATAEVRGVKRALVAEVNDFKAQMAKEMKEMKLLLLRNGCSTQGCSAHASAGDKRVLELHGQENATDDPHTKQRKRSAQVCKLCGHYRWVGKWKGLHNPKGECCVPDEEQSTAGGVVGGKRVCECGDCKGQGSVVVQDAADAAAAAGGAAPSDHAASSGAEHSHEGDGNKSKKARQPRKCLKCGHNIIVKYWATSHSIGGRKGEPNACLVDPDNYSKTRKDWSTKATCPCNVCKTHFSDSSPGHHHHE